MPIAIILLRESRADIGAFYLNQIAPDKRDCRNVARNTIVNRKATFRLVELSNTDKLVRKAAFRGTVNFTDGTVLHLSSEKKTAWRDSRSRPSDPDFVADGRL